MTKVTTRKKRRSDEIESRIFETYNNSVTPHGCHILTTTSAFDTATICPCNSVHHMLPHWKYVLCCYDKCTSMVIPSEEAIKIQQRYVQKYVFMSTEMYPVVH